MKINTDVSAALRQADTAAQATKTTNASHIAHATRPAAASSSVKISDATRALKTDSSEAPFDAKRVDEIKAAISAGTFKVNADAVAGKLLESVKSLLTDKS